MFVTLSSELYQRIEVYNDSLYNIICVNKPCDNSLYIYMFWCLGNNQTIPWAKEILQSQYKKPSHWCEAWDSL